MQVALDGQTVTTAEGVVFRLTICDVGFELNASPETMGLLRQSVGESHQDYALRAARLAQEAARAWWESMESLDSAASRRGTTPAYLRVRIQRGSLPAVKVTSPAGKPAWRVHRDSK